MKDSTTSETPPQKNPTISAEIVSSVKRRLWEETAEGVGNVVGNLGEAWYNGSDAVFYTREKERFGKYIPPFQYGAAATLFLFVNFRVTGNPRFQEWRKETWKRFRPKSPPKEQMPTKPPPVTGYLETKRQENIKKALQSMRFLTDGLISLTVGTSGTLFLLEAKCGKDLRSDYESAPLVAGRSLLADQMCPGMVELYRSDPNVQKVLDVQAKSEKVNGLQTGDPTLAAFATFIGNCQKRADHEARLRKEQNGIQMGKDSVLIPHTGVR